MLKRQRLFQANKKKLFFFYAFFFRREGGGRTQIKLKCDWHWFKVDIMIEYQRIFFIHRHYRFEHLLRFSLKFYSLCCGRKKEQTKLRNREWDRDPIKKADANILWLEFSAELSFDLAIGGALSSVPCSSDDKFGWLCSEDVERLVCRFRHPHSNIINRICPRSVLVIRRPKCWFAWVNMSECVCVFLVVLYWSGGFSVAFRWLYFMRSPNVFWCDR